MEETIEITPEVSSNIFKVMVGMRTCHTCRVGSASENSAVESEANSLSVVDLDTTLCLLLPQLSMAKLDGPVSARTNPEVERMVLTSPAKSASQKREMLSNSCVS